MLGGFVWVLGDLFQQYATKYVGISRGIPLSNTNQLWGLLWGILVFHELRGAGQTVYAQVAGGSLLMALGAVAIALSSATEREHSSWQDAAEREGQRYGVEDEYVRAGMEGREMARAEGAGEDSPRDRNSRTLLDWLLILGTTGTVRRACFDGTTAPHRYRCGLGGCANRRDARPAGDLRHRSLAHHPFPL